MKTCLEAIEHLRLKLRRFGVPMPQGEPTYVLCDNESVVRNAANVESTLNKNIRQWLTIIVDDRWLLE